jgi:alkanesulfonate monooxygenase SsuD/methylene tetrahydromethanopterin reductase-like flavin-dependent oxidoreductase (luciferase family)
LEETLQIITDLWHQGQATFEGKHFRVQHAICAPRPDPVPPIVLGAFKPMMLRLVAQYADGWDVSSTSLERYHALNMQLERACAGLGRDPSTIRRSWSGGCACAPTQMEAEVLAGDSFRATAEAGDFGFVGTPEQSVQSARSATFQARLRRFSADSRPRPVHQ